MEIRPIHMKPRVKIGTRFLRLQLLLNAADEARVSNCKGG